MGTSAHFALIRNHTGGPGLTKICVTGRRTWVLQVGCWAVEGVHSLDDEAGTSVNFRSLFECGSLVPEEIIWPSSTEMRFARLPLQCIAYEFQLCAVNAMESMHPAQ